MTVQSQDLEHGGKRPERPTQERNRAPAEKRNEREKGPAPPKDKGKGTYSGTDTPSRTD